MDLFDPKSLIETFGTIGLILIIFAESGLLLGLIFPGDSLLFTAGLLAGSNKFGLNIVVVAGGVFIAAVAGAQVGYWLGRKYGPALFKRPDSRVTICRSCRCSSFKSGKPESILTEPAMEVSGFRISCAIAAARRPTAAKRSCMRTSRSRRRISVRSSNV